MVVKRLILPFSKKFPEFVLCPVSWAIRAVTKNQSYFDFQMTPVFLIIVKSFREVCILDRNVKSFHNLPYLMHNA